VSGLFLQHNSGFTPAARLGTSPLALFLPAFAEPSSSPRELKADVCVVGDGVGGIAAALGAARGGASFVLTEEFEWVSG